MLCTEFQRNKLSALETWDQHFTCCVYIFVQHTYTTWLKVSGHLLVEHLIPKSWALIWSWSPLCCYNSLHFSGKAFHKTLEHYSRDLFHSATRALVRSGTDVGRLGLARSRCSNSYQMCLMGLRSGLCAGQSSSSTPISTNHFCMDLALCIVMLKQERAFPKLFS
jgi:hypothetical protein